VRAVSRQDNRAIELKRLLPNIQDRIFGGEASAKLPDGPSRNSLQSITGVGKSIAMRGPVAHLRWMV